MLPSELIDDRKAQLRRWLGAAIVIIGVHFAGATLALMQWPEAESDPDPSGAVVMELAALAVLPPDIQDLAIGPLVEDAAPTPIPTEESIPEDLEIPTAEEAPLAPDPELVLPKDEPVETLKETEEPEQVQTQQVTEVNLASAVATAPPKVLDAAPSEMVRAQTVGATAEETQAEITWQRALLLHLNRHKRYPAEARNRMVQGVAKVEFKIDAAGNLTQAEIVRGSGSKLLDEEALEVLKRASPFPPPPERSYTPDFVLSLPIEFRIR